MTKRDKIILLLKTVSINREMDSGFKELIKRLPVDKLPKLKKLQDKFITRFDQLTKETFEGQIALYDQLLSEDAIDASNHFYSTIEGQEIVSKIPALNEGLSELTFNFMSKLAKEFINDLLKLAPTEEEMTLIGFTKISADVSEFFDDEDEDEDETVDKINVKDDDDEDNYEQFFKDYNV